MRRKRLGDKKSLSDPCQKKIKESKISVIRVPRKVERGIRTERNIEDMHSHTA